MSDDTGQVESKLEASRPRALPVEHQPPLSLPLVQAVRFCRACGAGWQPEWDACPRCAARVLPSTATFQLAEERRAVSTAVQLYLFLLSISIATLIVLAVTHEALTLRGVFIEAGAMSLLTTLWCFRRARQIKTQLARAAPLRWFALGAAMAIPTFLIAHTIVSMLEQYFGGSSTRYLESFGAGGFGMTVLLVCVQPAIFEELAFRGFILTALQSVMGNSEAILVSAGMFAILHLSVPSIPHLFVIGAALGWLRTRTGSLYPGMLMHFTHNLLVILAEKHGGILPW